MQCTFAGIGGDYYRCCACGLIVRSSHPPENIYAACGAAGTGPPTPATAEEIARRLAICKPCDKCVAGKNCERFFTCWQREGEWERLLKRVKPACPRWAAGR